MNFTFMEFKIYKYNSEILFYKDKICSLSFSSLYRDDEGQNYEINFNMEYNDGKIELEFMNIYKNFSKNIKQMIIYYENYFKDLNFKQKIIDLTMEKAKKEIEQFRNFCDFVLSKEAEMEKNLENSTYLDKKKLKNEHYLLINIDSEKTPYYFYVFCSDEKEFFTYQIKTKINDCEICFSINDELIPKMKKNFLNHKQIRLKRLLNTL